VVVRKGATLRLSTPLLDSNRSPFNTSNVSRGRVSVFRGAEADIIEQSLIRGRDN